MSDSFDTARTLRDLATKYNGNFDLNIRDDRVIFTIYDDDLVKMMNDLAVMFGPA